jgi:hypothetical protein
MPKLADGLWHLDGFPWDLFNVYLAGDVLRDRPAPRTLAGSTACAGPSGPLAVSPVGLEGRPGLPYEGGSDSALPAWEGCNWSEAVAGPARRRAGEDRQ